MRFRIKFGRVFTEYNHMKKAFFLVFIFFLFQGCTRAVHTDSAKIQIQLPGQSLEMAMKMLSSGAVAEPTSVEEITCFGVFVGGPDETLNRNVCSLGMKDEKSTIRSGGKMNFGDWMAAVPAGKNFEMDVPSGSDRVIHLVGFKMASSDECQNFKTAGIPDEDKMSSAFLLGTVGNLNLKPDETVTVPIAMKLDSSKTITGCSGPDAPKGNTIPYLRFENLGVFDPNTNMDIGVIYTCYQIYPSLFVGQGNPWIDPGGADIHINVSSLAFSGFYSNAGCSTAISDLVIPGGQSKSAIPYYFKTSVPLVSKNFRALTYTGNTKVITGAQQTIDIQ